MVWNLRNTGTYREIMYFETIRRRELELIHRQVSKHWYTRYREGSCSFSIPLGDRFVLSIAVICTNNSPYRGGRYISTESLLFDNGEEEPAGYGNRMFGKGSRPSDALNISDIQAFLETMRDHADSTPSHGSECPE